VWKALAAPLLLLTFVSEDADEPRLLITTFTGHHMYPLPTITNRRARTSYREIREGRNEIFRAEKGLVALPELFVVQDPVTINTKTKRDQITREEMFQSQCHFPSMRAS
jgi:hypothetical protein